MKTELNKKFDGFIIYEEGKGYNGYSVDFGSLAGKSLSGKISLTEKQVGAITQTVFYEQTGGKIKIAEKEVSVSVVQVDFSQIAENGSADFNVVAKLDLPLHVIIKNIIKINTKITFQSYFHLKGAMKND